MKQSFSQRHYAVTIGHLMPGSFFATQAHDEIDAIARTGIPAVCIVPTVWQETFSSIRQFRAFGATPADDQLKDCIDHAHSRGLEVILRPMLECMDGATRLHIRFPRDGIIIPGKDKTYWKDWFPGLAERTRHYAGIAQAAGCEAYGIDSELDGAARDGTVFYEQEWRTVLQAARAEFQGPLTTNHTMRIDPADVLKISPNHWFRDLDFLELNFFVPLETAAFEAAKTSLRGVAEAVGKPVAFGACGCRSVAGGELDPTGWKLNEAAPDDSAQVRYLEEIERTFGKEPWWVGLTWHRWSEAPGDPKATGFSLRGKAGAATLGKIAGAEAPASRRDARH